MESAAAGPAGDEAHWDAAYGDRGVAEVSWFQPAATVSLALIGRLGIPRRAAVVDVGGGASVLVDGLVAQGFTDVSVLDVSGSALEAVHTRIGPHPGVVLIHADVLTWEPPRRFALWHDRAVFHFLVDARARAAYLATLDDALEPGGSVIVATFAPAGPEYCSGLPVARYGPDELAEALGAGFAVVEVLEEDHVTPAGVTQPFTWLAARRR